MLGSLEHLRQAPCTCRLVYRYRTSTYLRGRNIATLSEWCPMLKLSQHCDVCKAKGLHDYSPNDEAKDIGAAQVSIQCEDPHHDHLYVAVFHVENRDWETGAAEDGYWDMLPFAKEG